jgi:hypothetical protein
MSEILKPHLSASQLDSIARCPEAYRRRYIEGDKIPPAIAMIVGSGMHKGAETNFRQKIESHADLPVSQIVDAAVAGFEAQAAGGVSFSAEEASRGVKNVLGEAKDAVAEFATIHAKQQAPDYQPVMVEQAVRIELPGPRDLLGVIDLLDDQDRITDFKTAGKKKSQADADDNIGLSVYAASFQSIYKRPPALVQLDTIVRTKTRIERQVVQSERSEADMAALAARINVVSRQIEAGIFPPASPGAWWCNGTYCGFFSSCRFVNAERKAKADQ